MYMRRCTIREYCNLWGPTYIYKISQRSTAISTRLILYRNILIYEHCAFVYYELSNENYTNIFSFTRQTITCYDYYYLYYIGILVLLLLSSYRLLIIIIIIIIIIHVENYILFVLITQIYYLYYTYHLDSADISPNCIK